MVKLKSGVQGVSEAARSRNLPHLHNFCLPFSLQQKAGSLFPGAGRTAFGLENALTVENIYIINRCVDLSPKPLLPSPSAFFLSAPRILAVRLRPSRQDTGRFF